MGVKERVAKRARPVTQENEKEQELASGTSSGGVRERATRQMLVNGGAQQRASEYGDFLGRFNDYSGTLASEAKARDGVYQDPTQFSSYYDKKRGEMDDMLREAYGYRDYFRQYGDLYGKGYDSTLADINRVIKYLYDAQGSLEDEGRYWRGFENEDAYNRDRTIYAMQQGRAADAQLGQFGKGNIDLYNRPQYVNDDGSVSTVHSRSFNIDGKEVLLPTVGFGADGRPVSLTDDQVLQAYYDTGEYLGRFDSQEEADAYAELLHQAQDWYYGSRYKSTANGQEKFNAWNGTYSNTGFDDITYDYINRDENAIDRQRLANIQSNASLFGLDNGFLQQMTDDEIAVFNYLYANAGSEAAYQYVEDITGDLNYRRRMADEDEWARYAAEHPVGASAFSVLESPLKGLSYLGQATDYLADGTIDQNAAYNKFSYINSAIRGEVNDIVQNKWGGVGSFAYQTGMSMGDFLFNTAVSGGNEALVLAIMGTGAAADATISAKDRGLSDNQAFALGTIAGAAEIITEKVSVEALLDRTSLGKNAVGYLLKNVLAEGGEEVGSDIINLVADVLIAKDKSEWQTSINAYKAGGMDEDAAFWHAVLDQAETMGLDFLGGALSGGVMAGGAVAINGTANGINARRTGAEFNAMGEDMVRATIEEGLASNPSTRSYQLAQQLQQKLDAGQTISDAEIGRLYQANVQAIDAEGNADVILSRAAQEVQEGRQVSNRMASDILGDVNAVNALARDAGLSLTDDMTRSQRRSAVKSAVEALARSNTATEAARTQTGTQAQTTQQDTTQAANARNTVLSPAQQVKNAADIQQAAARSFGKAGAQQAVAFYNGDTAANDYYGSFAAYYQAGVNGSDVSSVGSRYAGVLNQAQQQAAYQAGRADAAASLERENRAAQFAPVAGRDSGLVADDYVLDNVEAATADKINSVAKLLGVRVQFVDSVRGGTANASISGADVLVEKNNPNPVMFLLGHEWTHRLQQLAPEQYRQFREAVAAEVQDAANVQQEIYGEQGESIDYEAALDEAVADYAGRMIEDGAVLDEFLEKHRDDRTLLEKVRDAIRSIIAKLTGAEKRQAQTAEAKLTAALEAATQQAAANAQGYQLTEAQQEAADFLATEEGQRVELSDANTRFSIREKDPPKKVGIAYKVFFAKDGNLYPPMVANPGGAGTPVGVWLDADIGAAAAPSKTGRMQVQAGGKGTSTGKGSLAFRPGWHLGDIPLAKQFARTNPETGVKDLFPADFVWAECEYAMDKDYQEEAMSYGYTENGKFRHSYAGLPRLPEDGYYRYRTNPNPDTVPWVITGAMRVTRILTDAETDAICRENGVEPMKRQGGPIDLSKYGLEAGDTTGKAKYSMKDSTGRTLTAQQAEYFRGSKIRDKDGNLLTLYHGTASDFTVFDLGRSGDNFGGWGQMGHGIYLTPDKSFAQYFAEGALHGNKPRLMETYANIRNPFNVMDPVSFNVSDLAEKYDLTEFDVAFLKKYGYRLMEFLNEHNEDIYDYLGGHGYDGVWDMGATGTSQVVAYEENQVKLASNKTPTKDVDVRFSMKQPVEETADLIALHNLSAEKLDKVLKLGGFPMPSIAVTKTSIPHTNFGDITLVMNKSTIDPQANRRNTVYSADAWTPTFPATEYEADEKIASKLRKRYYAWYDKFGDEATRPLYGLVNYADDELNRFGGEEGVTNRLRDNPDMMKLYLLDKGVELPAPVTEENVERLPDDTIKLYDHFISALGEETIREVTTRDGENPMQARKRWWADHGDDFEAAYKKYMLGLGIDEATVDHALESQTMASLLRHVVGARNYLNNGPEKRTTTTNVTATNNAIRAAVDQNEYNAWLDGLVGGIEKSSGIYNGKERYTSSGNTRSFASTHYPVTLENIARAMAAENGGNSRNVSGFYGVKSLRAGTAKRFSSIAEMHEYEGRLQHLSEEEAEQITDALAERLTAVMGNIYNTKAHGKYDNSFIEMDRIGEILMEVSEQKKITIDSIEKVFSNYSYKISNPVAEDIRNLLFDVSQMPVNIFEAKPERAVRFDEVLAAVVPQDTDPELVRRLKDAGVQNVVEYEKDNDADRLEKVNSVEGATFSLKGSEQAEEIAALRRQNETLRERVDYWRGQTRRSDRAAIDPKAVKQTIKGLASTYQAKLTTEETTQVTQDLQALYDYISRGSDATGELNWPDAYKRAYDIADVLVERATTSDDTMYQQYADLRKFLRDTRFTLTASESHDIPDFGDWRKRQYGRINVGIGEHSNVDVIYDEMAERWPEFFGRERGNGASGALERIADVMDGLYDLKEYNPHSAFLEQTKTGLANEIMEQFFEVPQVKKTFADRAAERLDEAKAHGREQVRKVREQKNAQIERLRAQNSQRVQEAIAKERERRDEQVQRLKDHYKKVREDAAARKADSAARSKLLRIAKRLQDAKLPAANRALLDQYIGDLDTVAKSMTGKTLDKLTNLREWYEDRKENDPDFISDPAIEKSLARLSKRHISDLSAEEVAGLTRVLLNIENELRTERQLIDKEDRRDTYHMGEETIKDVYGTRGSKGDFLDKYIVTETLSPLREMRRLTGYMDADPLAQLTQDLADGQRKMFDYQMRAERPAAQFAEDKDFSKFFSGKGADGIQVSGLTKDGIQTVTISPAMRTSLYLHSLNDQNLKHIRDGGITVPDWELYRKGKIAEAYARGTTVKLTPSQVRSITSHMTAKERAFARMAHNYFNGQSRNEINATSEKLKGYSLAQVENYFPINTDTSFTKSDFDTIKFDGSIEGMGFLKERVNAANPILLRDANEVLQQSIRQHAKYVGLAIPVRNFNKVWGVTTGSFNEDGTRNAYESSVQQAIKQQWGETAYNYVEKMMRDLQSGAEQKNTWAKALNKVRSNYAGAVLTLNASVAMKQAASYPTAAAVLGWGPLVRAMGDFGKVDLQTIEKYTPLQWYRSQGYSTKELGDLKNANRQLPAVLNWVQGADVLTTRKLWKASEYYVRQNNKGLARGSDAYYKAVADIYNRVIEETQPNYTTMQRPQLLRSDDTLMGNLAMFKTQPFQNFNILYDAAANLEAKARQGDPEALKAARRDFGRAVTSQIAQLAVFAAMTMAWSMFRGKDDKYKDDDGETTLLSVLAALGKDMVGGLLSGVPFGSDVWELASSKLFGDAYYGMDAVTVTAISDTISSLSGLTDLVSSSIKALATGEEVNWNSARIKADSYFDDISKALGIPYENVVNLFNAVARQVCIKANGKYVGTYQALKLTVDPTAKSAQYYDVLYKAYQNDQAAYREIYDDMISGGDFTAEKVKSAMETRMKKAQGVEKVSDLDSRYLSPDQQRTYDATLSGVQRSSIWRQANATQRGSAEDLLYELASGSSGGQKLREKIAGGARYGLDDTDYILYRLALSMADQPNDKGKLGTYTNDEVEEAIGMLTGLSDGARSYLWTAQGKSDTSNPWG